MHQKLQIDSILQRINILCSIFWLGQWLVEKTYWFTIKATVKAHALIWIKYKMGYIRKIDNIPPITLDTKQLGWLLYCALDISIKNRFGDRINRQYQEKKKFLLWKIIQRDLNLNSWIRKNLYKGSFKIFLEIKPEKLIKQV